MKDLRFWFFGAFIGLISTGNGQIMAFMNEHSALIGWLAMIFGITMVFITWLAFEHDRMIEEERSEST